MKLNNKGFAISTIMYMILIMAIVLITLTLSVLSARKMILDKIRKEASNNIYNTYDITYRQALKTLKEEAIAYKNNNTIASNSIKISDLNSSIDTAILDGYDLSDKYLTFNNNTAYLGKSKTITNIDTELDPFIDIYDYKIYGNSVKNNLPSAYQELEYIESTGTQYIDTNIKLNQNSRVKIMYQYKSDTSSTRVFGDATDTNNRWVLTTSNGTISAKIQLGWGDYWRPTSLESVSVVPSTNIVEYEKKGLYQYVNGKLYYNDTQKTFETAQTVKMFGAYYNSLALSKVRIYRVTIWQDGTNISRNFIPCYRKSDGVIGMYDTVNDVFYTNAGTGKFIEGPVKNLPDEYRQVQYIESTGTQRINTGYIPKINTKLKLDLSFSGTFNSSGVTVIFSSVSNGTLFNINFGGSANQGNTLFPWFNKSYSNGGSIQSFTITDDIRTSRNTLTVENGYVSYGTVGRSITSKTINNTSELFLFGSISSPFSAYNMRVYKMIISESGVVKGNYIPCYRKSDGVIGMYETESGIFYTNVGTGTFVKGADFTPTTYNSVGIDGMITDTVNLYDKNTYPPTYKKYINFRNGQDVSFGSNWSATLDYIPVEPNTQYTISHTKDVSLTGYSGLALYDSNYNYITGEHYDFTYTFTTPSNAAYIRFTLQTSDEYVQLQKGSTATAYEPFGHKISVMASNGTNSATTNIYLDEPLKKAGNYADYIDFKNQKICRNVGEFIFDGSVDEGWQIERLSAKNVNNFYKLTNGIKNNAEDNLLSSMGIGSNGIYNVGDIYVDSEHLNYAKTVYDTNYTLEDFKTSLYDNNLIVVAPLETPTEENITLPKTNYGIYNTISIDTGIKPSRVEFTVIEKIFEI